MKTKHTTTGKPEDLRNHRTVSELAEFLGVSERTVHRMYERGEIAEPAARSEKGWKLWSPAQCTIILRNYSAKQQRCRIK